MAKKAAVVRIRMLKTAAGPDGVWLAGSLVEMEGAAAALLVRAGAAVVEEEEAGDGKKAGEQGSGGAGETEEEEAVVVEEAVTRAPERAVGPRERGRRKGGL